MFCNAIIRAKGEAFSEEKLAVLFVLIAHKRSSPKLHYFIYKRADNFTFWHFMDMRKINAVLPVPSPNLKSIIID